MTKTVISTDQGLTRLGAKAREQLLEAAGAVFASKGMHEATSKEICKRAGMNAAAVNYHFGRFEALYIATLVEAHRRALQIEDVPQDTQNKMSAREKLETFLRLRLRRILQPISQSWEIRLLSRAGVSPFDEAHREFFKTAILPEHSFVKSQLGEMLGRKVDDPVVAHAFFSVFSPCIFLAIANRSITVEIFASGVKSEANASDALIDDFLRFAFAGLDALAADAISKRKK